MDRLAEQGRGDFCIGLTIVCLFGYLVVRHKEEVSAVAGVAIIASVLLIGLSYLSLPRTEVNG